MAAPITWRHLALWAVFLTGLALVPQFVGDRLGQPLKRCDHHPRRGRNGGKRVACARREDARRRIARGDQQCGQECEDGREAAHVRGGRSLRAFRRPASP
jgi:hypothetical protein